MKFRVFKAVHEFELWLCKVEWKGKELYFSVYSHSSTGALIGDTVN